MARAAVKVNLSRNNRRGSTLVCGWIFLSLFPDGQAAQEEDTADDEPANRYLGRFPLCYISWLLYSLLLVAKVVLLFRLNVAQVLDGS